MSTLILPDPDRGVTSRRNDIVKQLRKLVPEATLIADEEGRRTFECDALTAYRCLPLAVVLPCAGFADAEVDFENLEATRLPRGDELNDLIWQVYRTGLTLQREIDRHEEPHAPPAAGASIIQSSVAPDPWSHSKYQTAASAFPQRNSRASSSCSTRASPSAAGCRAASASASPW